MKVLSHIFCISIAATSVFACKAPAPTKEEITAKINSAITADSVLIQNLETLSTRYPARISGGETNAAAQKYVYSTMKEFGADSVWTQPVKITYWIPGESEVYLNVKGNGGRQYLRSIPLGTSAGTSEKGVTAQVVVVNTKEELLAANVKGRIVFLNQRMDDSVNTYGVVGWQRIGGPSIASEKGAKAAIIRSLTPEINNSPHTGVTRFEEGVKPIPAVAISTLAADNIEKLLKKNPNWTITVKCTSKMMPDTIGNNVIAQLRGSVHPENVILLSAHLDSWFNSQGCQDNAVSCCYAMEVLRIFKQLGITPKNTIRIINYQDEEMHLNGMREYARIAGEKDEKHIFDLEMDAGGGAPGRFLLNCPKEKADSISAFVMPILSNLGVKSIDSYQDLEDWPLSETTDAFFSLYYPESKGYFLLHHSEIDNFDIADPEKIKKSASAIATYIYLMDLYYGSCREQ